MMNRFDAFADKVANKIAHPSFFGGCVLLILVWFPTFPLFDNLANWQIPINTITTIVTFVLMALLYNTEHRFENAQNERWTALFALLEIEDPSSDDGQTPDQPVKVIPAPRTSE